jgi:monoamine oxidase
MPAQMFAAVPEGQPSLREAYELWAQARSPVGLADPGANPPADPNRLSVGIVGAGMAGLYAALWLRLFNVEVHLLESDPERLGGRIYTHRFNSEPNQYFEAGAMRLPGIPEQQPVFELIRYLNEKAPDPAERIETIPYVLYDDEGDLVFVNGKFGPDGKPMSVTYAETHPDELGFAAADTGGKTAAQLLNEVIGPMQRLLEEDFEKGFAEIVKYDDFSFRAYLAQVVGWSEDRINYVEVMTSQTNQFQNSFTELMIENMDFSRASWKTIANGMDRLPRLMARLIGQGNITMGARVTAISEGRDGRVSVDWEGSKPGSATFDKVLMALPPAALRMIATPTWSPAKTHAIRSLHFEPLYKIGLRFKTRFWEQVQTPARGGQSITDLPSRWFVYPSYGIGEGGPGVLLLYAWMTDAGGWLPQAESDRVRIALRDLQSVYGGMVDVEAQFLEAFEVNWAAEEPTGDAMFFPGQFKNLFNVARQPEGNVYFAGEHLSVHHTWIVGAVDSAMLACQQMIGQSDLAPLGVPGLRAPASRSYDYEQCVKAPTLFERGELDPRQPATA